MQEKFVLRLTEQLWYDILRQCINRYTTPTIYNRAEYVQQFGGIYIDDESTDWGSIIFDSEEHATWFLLNL